MRKTRNKRKGDRFGRPLFTVTTFHAPDGEVAPLQASSHCNKTTPAAFLNISYVCPEPVVVK